MSDCLPANWHDCSSSPQWRDTRYFWAAHTWKTCKDTFVDAIILINQYTNKEKRTTKRYRDKSSHEMSIVLLFSVSKSARRSFTTTATIIPSSSSSGWSAVRPETAASSWWTSSELNMHSGVIEGKGFIITKTMLTFRSNYDYVDVSVLHHEKEKSD